MSLTIKLCSNQIFLDTSVDLSFCHIAVDSRKVIPGSLFFALPGEKTDGHQFLEEVKKRGAIAAVVSKKYQGFHFGLKLIYVEDVLQYLHHLTKKVVEKINVPIVAITGSYGKTTTKNFIATVLEQRFCVGKTPGNQNSQIGVPLSIFNSFTGKEKIWVIEMGMSQKGEIAKLCEIAPPQVAVITGIDYVHGEFFDSLEGIIQAKAEILSKAKVVVIHRDIFEKFKKWIGCQTIIYDEKDLHLPIAKHLLANANCAKQVGKIFHLTKEEIERGLNSLKGESKRFETVVHNGITFINDSYNASPKTVLAALENLPNPQKGGKKIAVLGQMNELGKFSEECHLLVGKKAEEEVDEVIFFGEHFKKAKEFLQKSQIPISLFFSKNLVKEKLKKVAKKGDVVLIKGANTLKLWELIDK